MPTLIRTRDVAARNMMSDYRAAACPDASRRAMAVAAALTRAAERKRARGRGPIVAPGRVTIGWSRRARGDRLETRSLRGLRMCSGCLLVDGLGIALGVRAG